MELAIFWMQACAEYVTFSQTPEMEVVCAMGLICAFAAVHISWAGSEIWGPALPGAN